MPDIPVSQHTRNGGRTDVSAHQRHISNLPHLSNPVTEQELKLVMRRLNAKTLKLSDVPFPMSGEGFKLTADQNAKGLAWLKKHYKNDMGYREQNVIDTFQEIRWIDAYQEWPSQYYYPYYRVVGSGGTFEYYVSGGKLNILG